MGRKQRGSGVNEESYIEELVRESLDYFIDLCGLRGKRVSVEDVRDVLRGFVESLVEGRRTRITLNQLLRKIDYNRPGMLKALAHRIVSRDGPLSEDELELVILGSPETAALAAPRIYHELLERGREDLARQLAEAYEVHSSREYRCPECGFLSVGHTFQCEVCGHMLAEEEVREAIGLEERIREGFTGSPPHVLDEIIESGYVVYFRGELLPPSQGERGIKIYLNPRDIQLLRELKRGSRGRSV